MDFQINIQTDFELQMEQFLHGLSERGYSQATINGYRAYLNRMKKYILSLPEPMYTEEVAHEFMENVVPRLPISTSSKKHIQTSIRRFNDHLAGRPYIFRKNKGAQMPPVIFRDIVNDYIADMAKRGYRPATIEVRKIFAVQFLISVYKQGIHSINEISGTHVRCAVLSAASVEGMCQKLPCFLKYLHKNGLTAFELQKAIPAVIPKKNLPSVYNRDELIRILSCIDISSVSGKRDYAILILLMTYGLRVKDLIELRMENIDFQHSRLSFTQSKTGSQYCAELLQPVKTALESYFAEINPLKENDVLFYSTYAPCQPLSRGAVWSIVSRRIDAAVDAADRHRGAHAMRSSLASGLIADDVPYAVVQDVMGHADPNATKRYVAIDIERLRKCSLECPAATGRFLSYLEGGEWR